MLLSTAIDTEVLAAWREDLQEKRLARPHPCACGKVRPGEVRLPSEMRCGVREVPWWKIAPPIVHVCLLTGRVWVWRLWEL